jgi:hypothetical protein
MFFLLLIGIIIIFLKYIYDQNQNNLEAEIIEIQSLNRDTILDKKQHKSPILIHNHIQKFNNLDQLIKENPGYMIEDKNKLISFQSFSQSENNLFIYQNKKIYDDLFHRELNELSECFTDKLNCYDQYYISLFKGNHYIQLTENKNDVFFLKPIENTIIVYLINPKHKTEIKDKDQQSIKKWSHRIELNENNILFIPVNWFYFYETANLKNTIIGSFHCDNYFTFLYNHLK